MEEQDFEYQLDFVDPYGVSALRSGPRIYKCPTCKKPNKLSKKDTELGYQCDSCADKAERNSDY